MTSQNPHRWTTPLEALCAWLVLAVMLLLTYARFAVIPYAGLYIPQSGLVSEIYVRAPAADALQLDDKVMQVGPVLWADYQAHLRQQIFQGVQPGEIVPLRIERNGVDLTVAWAFPGPTVEEIFARLFGEWPLAYVFWLAGVAAILFVRPQDELQRLLIAFNFLTALWLIAGSTTSRWHVWEGAIILRSAVWLAAPVYLHLHWVFPKPFRRLPAWFVWVLYLLAAAFALLEWFEVLPTGLYFVAFLPAIAGSLVLLIAHAILQPTQRREVARLVVIWVAALLPTLFLGLISVSQVPAFAGGFLVALPALPVAYLYAAFRRHYGPHEVRANRLLALYLFIVVVGTLVALVVPWTALPVPGGAAVGSFMVALVSTTLGVLLFPRFQGWVERRVLGVTWPTAQLLEKYAERITTSLDTERLVGLLTGELLPSLLIRQSALLRVDAGRLSVIYQHGLGAGQLPGNEQWPSLLPANGRPAPNPRPNGDPLAWVLLSLPLQVKGELVGLWLLGRRDPDDAYRAADVALLQTIAHQTAMALTNISYAERLHVLHQSAIDQREAERVSLSRELHDHVLQRLFILKSSDPALLDSPAFEQNLQLVTLSLTQTIRGLRPPMLEYGLYPALVALADEWANRPEHSGAAVPAITCALPESDARYDHQDEQHLFRIVQQAGENALEHARPQRLTLTGRLEPERVELVIEDDGLGFDPEASLDPSSLEAAGHYGLPGMRERAALIGAQLAFESTPGQGTRVRLTWQPKPPAG